MLGGAGKVGFAERVLLGDSSVKVCKGVIDFEEIVEGEGERACHCAGAQEC